MTLDSIDSSVITRSLYHSTLPAVRRGYNAVRMKTTTHECDVLVIGSGMGGLRASIEARRAGLNTLLVEKSILTRASASIYAGALVARVPPGYLVKMGLAEPGMNFEASIEDSFQYFVREGARTGGSNFTANQRIAMTVACEMQTRAEELRDFGVEDIYAQRWLGPPAVYGTHIMLPLLEHARKIGVKTRIMTMITDFIRQDGEIVGAVGFDLRKKQFVTFRATSIVMATGSCGQIYERSYAPIRMTGDGLAMACRAGATLTDMEMMGFDNWGVALDGVAQYWIPGSVARTRGVLRNAKGEAFFLKYAQEHKVVGKGATLSLDDNLSKRYGRPFIELVPHLIKASMKEILEGRGENNAVFLDLTKVPKELWNVDSKGIFTQNLLRGFNLQERPLPVAPICIGDFKGGGVRIDERGRTDVPGLFAAGDVSPGSSLLYALVTGVMAGRSATQRARATAVPELAPESREWARDRAAALETILSRRPGHIGDPASIKSRIKAIMWKSAGPLRDGRGLQWGLEGLRAVEEEAIPNLSASGSYRKLREAMETINMAMSGQSIISSSLHRTESRGYNQRLDYPDRDDTNWLRNTTLTRTGDAVMTVASEPVDLVFMKPEGYEERAT
ncbi:MAG: hypothetical protein CL476_10820 [Acidobacteria bacterium]|nr:hypothetical protein [Acidobacteriota bacterium]